MLNDMSSEKTTLWHMLISAAIRWKSNLIIFKSTRLAALGKNVNFISLAFYILF